MATGRIISKNISTSEKVADLTIESQLLYTWMIPHTDDLGLLQNSARTIKATVVPMHDLFTVKTVDTCLQELIAAELLKIVTFEEKQYLFIIGFNKKQTFKRDRQPQTILPINFDKKPSETWNLCEQIVDNFSVSKCIPVGFQLEEEVKGSEEKRSEEKNDDKTSSEVSYVKNEDEDYLALATESDSRINSEWQATAYEIIKALKISDKRKSAYFAACKRESLGLIESAFSFASDYPTQSMKDKMFFWKLSELKKEQRAKK